MKEHNKQIKESQDILKTFLGLITKLFSTEKVSEFKNQDLEKMLDHLKTQHPQILTALNEILNSITEIDHSKKIPTESTELTIAQLTEATQYAKENGLNYEDTFNAIKDKIDPSKPSMTAPGKDPVPREIIKIETDERTVTLIINDEPKGPFLMIEVYNKENNATELLLNWDAAHRIIMIDKISADINKKFTSTKVLCYADKEKNPFPPQKKRELTDIPSYLLRFKLEKKIPQEEEEIPQNISFTAILSRATTFLDDNTFGSRFLPTHNKITITKPKDLGNNFYAYIVTKGWSNVGIAIMEKTKDELNCHVYFGPDRFDKNLDPRNQTLLQIAWNFRSIVTNVANLHPTFAINTVTRSYQV